MALRGAAPLLSYVPAPRGSAFRLLCLVLLCCCCVRSGGAGGFSAAAFCGLVLRGGLAGFFPGRPVALLEAAASFSSFVPALGGGLVGVPCCVGAAVLWFWCLSAVQLSWGALLLLPVLFAGLALVCVPPPGPLWAVVVGPLWAAPCGLPLVGCFCFWTPPAPGGLVPSGPSWACSFWPGFAGACPRLRGAWVHLGFGPGCALVSSVPSPLAGGSSCRGACVTISLSLPSCASCANCSFCLCLSAAFFSALAFLRSSCSSRRLAASASASCSRRRRCSSAASASRRAVSARSLDALRTSSSTSSPGRRHVSPPSRLLCQPPPGSHTTPPDGRSIRHRPPCRL